MRICLVTWQYDALAKAYNAPTNPHGTRAVIAQFIEQLESVITAQHSIPKFSEVEKEFHIYLKSVGKVAPKLAAPKPRGVAQILAEREAAAAAAKVRPS